MVNYRRNRIPGGTFFFTVTLRDRRSRLLIEQIDPLRKAFGIVCRQSPFCIEAIVVLPDHLHAVWTLPPGDDDFPSRWKAIKGRFTAMVRKGGMPLG
ncbi:MAG: transposase [Deltaproteobacteria bacterium]|nr:transposase [Deltaproteobacteria bacterium]